jgi:hypothetical protein
VGFFCADFFYGVCSGFVFGVGLFFGVCLIVVVVVGAFFRCGLRHFGGCLQQFEMWLWHLADFFKIEIFMLW